MIIKGYKIDYFNFRLKEVELNTEETFSFKGDNCKMYQEVKETTDHYEVVENYGCGAVMFLLYKDPVNAANILIDTMVKDMKNKIIAYVDNL